LRLAEHFAKDNDGDLCQTRIMKFLGVCLSASILGKVSSFAQPLSRASAFGVRAPTRRSDVRRPTLAMSDARYTIPDQPARFAQAVAEKNVRVLDIDAVFDPSSLKGLRVAVTGANRGIGLALSTELVAVGAQVVAIVRSSSPALDALGVAEVITGVDATDDDICGSGMCEQIKGGPIDVLINNAGYFYEPVETLDSLNFPEELKMIDICALGPLRVTSALNKGGFFKENSSRIVMITSQGGAISWRTTQNPTGEDYGHHMSKAAANMMAVLLSQELKSRGIAVGILHPGFNKTEMTAKYKEIWEIEGAVDPAVGAKRVLHEITLLDMARTGKFYNCEDGLEIPW